MTLEEYIKGPDNKAVSDLRTAMSAVRLLALDVDGTLLTDMKVLTKRTDSAVKQAAACGLIPVIVTGRPFSGLPVEITGIPGIRYAVTSNGAETLDMSEYDTSGRCTSLRHSYLEKETAVWVAKMCMEHGLMHSVFIEGKGYSEPHFHKMILDMFMGTQYEDYVKASRSSSEDIVAQIEDTASGVENIWIRCSSRYERDMIDRSIRKHFPVNTVLTADTDVEVGNICASKGLALKELALSLGIRKNQVIAIGDNENDLDMLNESGIPVAMGNATDNVKAIASLITYSNEEDGAAEAIEQVIAACLKEKQAAFS